MLVKESTETAFGAPIKGVTIQLTADEAKTLCPALLQAVVNPPKARNGNGLNPDWAAKDIAGKIYDELRKVLTI